jgi:hypothetical protein
LRAREYEKCKWRLSYMELFIFFKKELYFEVLKISEEIQNIDNDVCYERAKYQC